MPNGDLKNMIKTMMKRLIFAIIFNNDKLCPYEEIWCKFQHKETIKCKFDHDCRFKLCQFRHSGTVESNDKSVLNHSDNGSKKEDTNEGANLDISKDTSADDVNATNGDKSEKVNTEDILENDDSEIEDDDETEIIYQKFLENHKKREDEKKKKSNVENVAAQIQQFN
jgi:hypothetical protein